MSKKSPDDVMLVEHILEVRHQASGKFLDIRGNVADYIRNLELFQHWSIDSNVVNFRDTQSKIDTDGAFASYKAAGYIVYNPGTKNYFTDKASAYWKALVKNGHYTLPDLVRFGVRTKVFIPSQKPFEEIKTILFDKFFAPGAKDLLGGKVEDVQFVFVLKENEFDVKVYGGPIHENEVAKYMSFDADQFKNRGVYIDIDYSKLTDIDNKSIPNLLKESIELTWKKIDNITKEIGI